MLILAFDNEKHNYYLLIYISIITSFLILDTDNNKISYYRLFYISIILNKFTLLSKS